jgi:protein gp37
MGDIFHPENPYERIDDVFNVATTISRHIHMFLTKCPGNMNIYLEKWIERHGPLPSNIWLGVTIESKHEIYRGEELIKAQHDNLFISLEPLQGPVYIGHLFPIIKWVVTGGGTGLKSKPMHSQWPEDIMIQCQNAGVPFFFKGWGNWGLDVCGNIGVNVQGETRKITTKTKLDMYEDTVKFMSKEKAGSVLSGENRFEVPWTDFFISKK